MKRSTFGFCLAWAAMSSSAFDLVVQTPVATGVNPITSFDVSIAGFTATNGWIGELWVVDGSADVTYTYLGKEAGFSNSFFNPGGSVPTIADTDPALTASTQFGVSGLLDFGFRTFGVDTVSNGSAGTVEPTFAIFSGGTSGYKYIIGYSDGGSGPDHDYDDMVFGVNAAIPEPQTFALLLAGLSAVGFIARRRRPR